MRDTDDRVEVEGVERSRGAASTADLVLVVHDHSLQSHQHIDYKGLIVLNKTDLPAGRKHPYDVAVSAATGQGLDDLCRRIVTELDVDLLRDRPAITNVRHVALVERAHAALSRARQAAMTYGGSMSEEFVLADLSDARAALEEVCGRRAPEDLLEHIFSKFCIGK